LKKCNLAPGRITRWVLQLQEYDLDIVHIKGTENHFADILSRRTDTESLTSRKSNKCLVATSSFKQLFNCTHEAEWTPFQTHYFSENLVVPAIEPGSSGSVARDSEH
jgi:hypothetical protein